MSNRPRRAPDVPTMEVAPHLRGLNDRAALNSRQPTGEKIRLGDQIAQEEAEFRARFYFQPRVAARLRAATSKALGRRLGGDR